MCVAAPVSRVGAWGLKGHQIPHAPDDDRGAPPPWPKLLLTVCHVLIGVASSQVFSQQMQVNGKPKEKNAGMEKSTEVTEMIST
jgi:hypothetical protein